MAAATAETGFAEDYQAQAARAVAAWADPAAKGS